MSEDKFQMDATTDDDFIPKYKPSYVLIVIDTHESMFVTNSDGTCPFQEAVKACYNLVDSLVFAQPRSYAPFAIIVADNDESKSHLIKFDTNLLETAKLLKKLDFDSFKKRSNFDLAQFFLSCKKLFQSIKTPYYRRKLIYVTNDENPVKGDSNLKFTALNEAKTLQPCDIDFRLIPMREDFDYNVFYNELFNVGDIQNCDEICLDSEGLLEHFHLAICWRQLQRKLILFPFQNDHKRYLKIVKNDYISEAKLYNNAHVSSVTKEEVKKKTQVTETEAYTFKVKDIKFEMYEKLAVEEKATAVPVGYTLMYVANRTTKPGFTLTKPTLIQVDSKEEQSEFFDNFWQYCVDNNKVLVCAARLTKSSKIRYVEFIPKFVKGVRTFLVTYIPFCNEINYPPLDQCKAVDEIDNRQNKTDAVHELVNALTFDFERQLCTNISLAKKRAYVKAKLLDEQYEDVVKETISNEVIDEKVADVVEEIKSLFPEIEAGKKATKRSATSTRGRATTSTKKSRK